MVKDVERFCAAVGSIYECTAEPEGWAVAVDGLCQCLGGDGALFSISASDPALSFTVATGALEPADAEKFDHARSGECLSDLSILSLREGTVVCDGDLVYGPEFTDSAFYREYLAPKGFYHVLGAVPVRNNRMVAILLFLRRRGLAAFASEETMLYNVLGPHVYRALTILLRDRERERAHDSAYRALDDQVTGILMLGADGRVLHMNRAARWLLERRVGIELDLAGHCQATSPNDSPQFRRLVAGAAGRARTDGKPVPGVMTLTPYGAGAGLTVKAVPVGGGRQGQGQAGQTRPGGASESWPMSRHRVPGAALMLYVADPERSLSARNGELQDLYGLTGAEARLVEAVVAGQNVADYAEITNHSIHTIRTQMKSAMGKLGVRSQADVVRLVTKGISGAVMIAPPVVLSGLIQTLLPGASA